MAKTPAKAPAKTTAAKVKKPKKEELVRHVVTNETPEVINVSGKKRKDEIDDITKVSIEKRLIALMSLQKVDSQIDKIHIVRGELPLEVQDLEDTIAGINTRIENYKTDVIKLDSDVKIKQQAIKDAQSLIKKYEDQKNKVRNNREFDSLSKEIEYQSLEIQLCEKKINEYKHMLEAKKEAITVTTEELEDYKLDLQSKQKELKEIASETEKEEKDLLKKSQEHQKFIEERLLTAYTRIRKNTRNGLAVVKIERDACGGCFNKIPPQRQLDIRLHKKIIVCEYCGRILIDDEIFEAAK